MVAGAQGANVAGQLAGHAGRLSGAGPSFDTLSAKISACPIACEHRAPDDYGWLAGVEPQARQCRALSMDTGRSRAFSRVQSEHRAHLMPQDVAMEQPQSRIAGLRLWQQTSITSLW